MKTLISILCYTIGTAIALVCVGVFARLAFELLKLGWFARIGHY